MRKKVVNWLGIDAQSWRCREEDPHAPLSSLPQYPTLPEKFLALCAHVAQEWQESHGLLVVAARRVSVYHGGSRLQRKWRHARKLRRLWGHVPAILWPYICGMSDPEREPGSEPVLDVETFTQSLPAVVLGAASLREVTAAEVIVRWVNRVRALRIQIACYLHVFAYFRMASAPQVTSRADARCRRLPLPPHLCGPLIPLAFQTRMRVMLMVSVASSLSFEFGNLHRLVTNWACVPLAQQAIAGMGAPSSMEYLIGPLKNPKVIPQDSRKAFEQVLTSVADGYLHADVERWRGFSPSKLKTVPKVKASTLNLNDVKGGEGLNNFFSSGRRGEPGLHEGIPFQQCDME